MGSKGAIVEIGAAEARGMLFSSSLGGIRIEKVEAFPIEEGKASYAVERLLSAFPLEAPVALLLPGHLFLVRNASFPFTDRKKIRKALPFQLDGLFPLSVDELLMDSVLSAPSSKGSNVMATAIPKKTVAGYLNLFPAGRRPSKIIPDFISLLSLGKGAGGGGRLCGAVEIREGNASIVILSGGRPVLMRSILPASGAAISDEIVSTIKPFLIEKQQGGNLYMSGPGAHHAAPLLRETFVNPLPLPVAVKGISPGDWPLWAILAGGAMASSEYPEVNILGFGAETERFERLLKFLAIGAALLLLLGSVDLYMHYRTAHKRYSALKAESNKIFLSVMPQVKKIVKEDAQMKDALNKAKGIREALIGKPSPSYIAIFNTMKDIIGGHPEIKVREAVFEGDSLTVSGSGSGIESEGIKRIFSGIKGVKGLQVEEIVQGVEPNSYRFRIKMDITAVVNK